MLQRLLKLQSPIRKALKDLKSSIVFSDIEFTQIENVVRALEMVMLTVDALCRRDANLLSVPPTIVESERAFSAAGVVYSKLRTRLDDET